MPGRYGRCHRHVGRAILNTSITITFGFSILVLSNFIPTIYFGIFTGLAMIAVLLAVLITHAETDTNLEAV